ncbi:MAG: hypothetical protein ABIO16_13255, partial [Nocardioides sp.]
MRGGDEILLGFARAVRAAGVPVTTDRSQGFLQAMALLDLADERATWVAGRSTLCAGPDDLARFDAVFEAFFNARDGLPRTRPTVPTPPQTTPFPESERDGDDADSETETVFASA